MAYTAGGVLDISNIVDSQISTLWTTARGKNNIYCKQNKNKKQIRKPNIDIHVQLIFIVFKSKISNCYAL